MAKVTSKLQVTIPKALAQQCGIRSGDDIQWSSAADGIRLAPASTKANVSSIENRLEFFDAGRYVRRSGNAERGVPSPENAVGRERISTIVAALVDTNILVYRFDPAGSAEAGNR
jgi:bifunctional DNA-binding transcriptional regulator/antitoxin component of YhaV-PrlF toxin-antitoxin module